MHPQSLSLSHILHIDEICRRFEGAWKDAAVIEQRPVVEAYLVDIPAPIRGRLVCELVRLDVYYRAQAGEVLRAVDLQARFPDLDAAWLNQTLEAIALDTPVPSSAAPAGDDAGVAASGLEILYELGRGGMGAVFKGRDLHLGRDVAVKVLLDRHQGHPELERRFLAEARIGGQLQHPGIVPVYSLNEVGAGRPYFTMKLVEGQTLAALLRERADPARELPRFLSVFEQVCQTLAYVHAQGVIHRDLKPANVMVGAFGEVQVMDWGLAKRVGVPDEEPVGTAGDDDLSAGNGQTRTRPGRVLGTLAYMAPEQARGEVERLDERCDVFGLGALLCEILTGRPAYGESEDGSPVYQQAQQGDLTEAWTRLAGCGANEELVRLAKACLATERDERPRHAGVVAEAVTAYLAGVAERLRAAEVARAMAEVERAAAQAQAAAEHKRWQLTAALAAAVLALGLLGGGGAWWLAGQRAEAERAVNLAYREAHGLHDQARMASASDLLAWTKAVDAAQRADELAAGGWVAAPVRQEAAELRQQVQEEFAAVERDRDLLARLAEIRIQKEDEFGHADAEGAYARAFRDYGLDVDLLPSEAAARIRARPPQVAAELTAALDDWALERRQLKRPEADWQRLLDVARQADADPWRQTLRVALGNKDRDAILRLADTAEVPRLPVPSVQLLTLVLRRADAGDRVETVLRAALHRYPGEAWLNHALAEHLCCREPRHLDEAIRFYTAARAVRPEISQRLGQALIENGNFAEAAAVFRELTRLRPANVLHRFYLGVALEKQGKHDEAVAAYQDAVHRQPDSPGPRYRLGLLLAEQGRLDEAVAAFQEILRRKPDLGIAHLSLGLALARQGKLEDALSSCRQALRHLPNHAEAHCHLGNILRQQGRFVEALASLKRGHELGNKKPRWSFPSDRWVSEVEHLMKAEAKLPAFLRGEAQPADDTERLALAEICHAHNRLHRTAARLYAEVFAAQTALADDVPTVYRYKAACAAALAGCGQGEDAPPDGPERVRWRQQALEWLRAELAAYAKLVENGKPEDRTRVQPQLRHWQRDPELASLRDDTALARLPEPERAGWRRLWEDVAVLLGRASAPR